MFPSPAPKNPSVDKATFQALERRVAALEAIVASIVTTDDDSEAGPVHEAEPSKEAEPARRGRKPKVQEE